MSNEPVRVDHAEVGTLVEPTVGAASTSDTTCVEHPPTRAHRIRCPRRHPRRSSHQHRQRACEQHIRRRVTQTGRQLIAGGWSWQSVAQLFQITARTLRRWCRDPSAVGLRGRPVQQSPRIVRDDVIHFLDEHGPHIGVPTLRECFPAISRAELTDLLRRYRRVWRARHRVPLRVLRWLVPGRVWSIDFTGPLKCLDGEDRFVLAVRDLASGYQLLWRAVPAATAEVVCAALSELFAEFDAPLVLKSDNGSAFISGVVQQLLTRYGVVGLYSPPHWPRYNGAIEAGIGSLKDRTAWWSARSGHAGVWTWDDLAGAGRGKRTGSSVVRVGYESERGVVRSRADP